MADEDKKAFVLDKGWIAKRSKNGSSLGMLTVQSEEESGGFNLSESGSYREGLLHISQAGTTIHSASDLKHGGGGSPESGRGTTSAKRAHKGAGGGIVRYELKAQDFGNMEVIGKGSSGFVRKALNRTRNTLVAIKVINVFEAEKRKQMMQEILMMCDMHCDALINFEGAFYNEGTINVVLEYMTAGSLEDLVELSGGVPEHILAYIAEQIFEGMAFMHARKQVHRDFKPCNVLVHHNGRVKISDFGVSAELDSSLVKCTTFVGTFLYMSPERFGSEPYSFPSDIWSLGLTLMQCATGEYPYLRNSGKTYWELMDAIVQTDAPALPDKGYTPDLHGMLNSCLQKEPRARPTAGELKTCPFIMKHCTAEPAEKRREAVGQWVGQCRTCFVSANLPSASNFSPADLAQNFAYFYTSFFQPGSKSTLWSLYQDKSEVSIGGKVFVGREGIMKRLVAIEAFVEVSSSQGAWASAATWDAASNTLSLQVPVIVRSVKAPGGEGEAAVFDFQIECDAKRKCYSVLRQAMPQL